MTDEAFRAKVKRIVGEYIEARNAAKYASEFDEYSSERHRVASDQLERLHRALCDAEWMEEEGS